MKTLNYGRHSIDDDDIATVVSVLRGDWITQGPILEEFERALAQKVGAKYAVAVSSGTAALHIACLAAGLKEGDRGITSALTFVAPANAMRYCGASVILTDIENTTLGMCPVDLKRKLLQEPDVSVVMPVHIGGLAGQAEEIRQVAANRIIIEDASHALGGSYSCGRPIGCGAYADMTTFSFHPVKPITTGEGGAVVTNNPELARLLRLFRSHGIERSDERMVNLDASREKGERCPWYYEHQALGFNYRLTDIQAALGLSQLNHLEEFTERRRKIVARYDEAFSRCIHMKKAQDNEACRERSAHHLYIGLFDFESFGGTRTEMMNDLRHQGIGTQVHYIPVYRQPYYQKILGDVRDSYPQVEKYYKECLSLPLFPKMSDEDVEFVIQAITKTIKGK